MTGEIINLNKVRKAKARAEKEKRAAENRTKFGASKVDRKRTEAEKRNRDTSLDGAKREKLARADDDLDPGSVL